MLVPSNPPGLPPPPARPPHSRRLPADAFETIIEILRVRKAHPDLAPERYAVVDERFRKFAACDLGAPRCSRGAGTGAVGGRAFAAAGRRTCAVCAGEVAPRCCTRGTANTPGRFYIKFTSFIHKAINATGVFV